MTVFWSWSYPSKSPTIEHGTVAPSFPGNQSG